MALKKWVSSIAAWEINTFVMTTLPSQVLVLQHEECESHRNLKRPQRNLKRHIGPPLGRDLVYWKPFAVHTSSCKGFPNKCITWSLLTWFMQMIISKGRRESVCWKITFLSVSFWASIHSSVCWACHSRCLVWAKKTIYLRRWFLMKYLNIWRVTCLFLYDHIFAGGGGRFLSATCPHYLRTAQCLYWCRRSWWYGWWWWCWCSWW